MSWQEQRRQDAAARAEQAREDRIAAARVEAIRTQTQVDAARAMSEQREAAVRVQRAERFAEKKQRQDGRKARWAALRGWCAARVVDLLIYPLAVVSAVMAVPAMAVFGHEVYGTAAGYALPVITELGMWAFAVAVHVVRHRNALDGGDRSVWALQLGVWSFATVAAGLNFLHGITTGGVTAGVVMAVASVAGVAAHQLVTAAPRRSRVERDTARIERRTAATVTRVRRAALRATVADIDPDGTARLLYTAGQYRLTRPRLARWRPARLTPVSIPDPQDTPAPEWAWDDLDRELAALLDTVDPYPGRTGGGGVGTVENPHPNTDQSTANTIGDQRESTPGSTRESGRGSGRTKRPRKPAKAPKQARSIEDLRIELRSRIETDPGSIDPTSAESIRRALRCSPARARELRDSFPTDRGGK